MSVGLTFIIIYSNLFAFGYSFFEYLEYILTSFYCLLFLIGFVLVNVLLILDEKKKQEKILTCVYIVVLSYFIDMDDENVKIKLI